MSVSQHASSGGTGKIWRVKKYIWFVAWNHKAKLKSQNFKKNKNPKKVFDLKVKKNVNRKESTPVKSFRPLSCSCSFSQQQSYQVFVSYEGAQCLPGHPRITSWVFGLHFKKPFLRHHPFHRRLIPPACLWRCPKFCICKEANENQRKPPLMACHESGSSDTNSSSPTKEWQKYGSESWRTSCCFLALPLKREEICDTAI